MAIRMDPIWDIAEELTFVHVVSLTSAELISFEALTDRKA